ncbi:MAG TPA: terpene synthase family protein [Chloroflexota bacterium]|nr:terpene synthase family protein [Chloroflexota bacterium]
MDRLLDQVVEQSNQWCSQWTIFNPTYVLPVALINIVQFPDLPILSILSRVKNSMWIYAIDDLVDGGKLTERELRIALFECALVASAADNIKPESELARTLQVLHRELMEFPNYQHVARMWSTSLIRTIDGMMYEYWMQRRYKPIQFTAELPPYDEYIYYARSSIAITYLWITGLILETDVGIKTELPGLFRLADQCALVIRLANDVCTFKRELEEGGVNAVALCISQLLATAGREPISNLIARASRTVSRRVDRELARARAIAKTVRTDSAVEERFLRATEVSVDLYRRSDIRVWSKIVNKNDFEGSSDRAGQVAGR